MTKTVPVPGTEATTDQKAPKPSSDVRKDGSILPPADEEADREGRGQKTLDPALLPIGDPASMA